MATLQKNKPCACGRTFDQNSYNHEHCVICSAEIQQRKSADKARARRERMKTQKENQSS